MKMRAQKTITLLTDQTHNPLVNTSNKLDADAPFSGYSAPHCDKRNRPKVHKEPPEAARLHCQEGYGFDLEISNKKVFENKKGAGNEWQGALEEL